MKTIMEAKYIFEKHAQRNMGQWNHSEFIKTHPKLYKAIIDSINEGLTLDDRLNEILPLKKRVN